MPRVLFTLLALCFLLAGCGGQGAHSGSSTSRVTAVSRVILPVNGGQTILPPQKMADVATLWAPLTARERRHLASFKALPVQLQTGHVVLQDWLPPSEQHTMQAYYYRLHTSRKDVMARTLQRASIHVPAIRETLRQYGVPEVLAYLPMVESAYEPEAVSPAGAVGLWQLMPATARRFGLTVNSSLDERLDPVKSTRAAVAYLRWLHDYFNDWPLAVTAYNCGEGTMQKALAEAKATTLVEVVQVSRLATTSQNQSASRPSRTPARLKEESLNFLPQLVAAANFFKEQGLNSPTGTMVSMAHTTPAPTWQDQQPLPRTDQQSSTDHSLRQKGALAQNGTPVQQRPPVQNRTSMQNRTPAQNWPSTQAKLQQGQLPQNFHPQAQTRHNEVEPAQGLHTQTEQIPVMKRLPHEASPLTER